MQFDEKPWRQIFFPPTFPTLIFPGKLLGAIEFPQLKSKTAVQSEQGPFVIFSFKKQLQRKHPKTYIDRPVKASKNLQWKCA
jgi:hypothetical protein